MRKYIRSVQKGARAIGNTIVENCGKVAAVGAVALTQVNTAAQATFPDFATSIDSVETLAISAATLGALIWLFLKARRVAGKTV